MASDVIGVGANSVDYLAVVPEIPAPSASVSKLPIASHAVMCGGQMATALATCSRFGLRTRYVGATGSDTNGHLVRDALSRLDVDISSLATRDAPNQFAFVLIHERTGERVIFWNRDHRLDLDESELPHDALATCRLVHVDDSDEAAAIAAARIARAHGVPVTSDIDRVTDRTRELITAVTVAIFAENVPLELSRDERAAASVRPELILAALSDLPRRSDQVFCATMGGRGAVAIDNDGGHYQPAFRVAVKDTTGAGDVFRGALIYARLQGRPLDDQLRFANAAAAAGCTRLGALASVPTLQEVEEILDLGP